jgi:hypothetical protein
MSDDAETIEYRGWTIEPNGNEWRFSKVWAVSDRFGTTYGPADSVQEAKDIIDQLMRDADLVTGFDPTI